MAGFCLARDWRHRKQAFGHMQATGPQTILDRLAAELFTLPGELRKVARYILDNPNEVAVASARGLARATGTKPNSVVRLARRLGFAGHEALREVFRNDVRKGAVSFPDRARWLQALSDEGRLGGLYGDMAESAITNVEATFAGTNAAAMQAAARTICDAREVYVLGVGINHTIARNFTYLADMAVNTMRTVPRDGTLAVDEVARAGPGDVLVAMTFHPYRVEVVEAVALARRQGVTVIGISDSAASPMVIGSEHAFIVPTESPQFFTSTFSLLALMETLMAFVIAEAGTDVVSNIRNFHQRRLELGLYVEG